MVAMYILLWWNSLQKSHQFVATTFLYLFLKDIKGILLNDPDGEDIIKAINDGVVSGRIRCKMVRILV